MSTSADPIVNIQKLVKTYPGKTPVEAVKGIDLAVARGEMFGLLGPNGAGKTTTISVCTTRALPTSGTVTIAGVDVVAHPAEARRFMGVVTQFNTLDRQCTVLGESVLSLPLFRHSAMRWLRRRQPNFLSCSS